MQFKLTRFKNILNLDFTLYRKPFLLGSVGLSVLLLLFTVYNGLVDDGWSHNRTGYLSEWIQTLLFVLGLFLTSIIFWEFRTPRGRMNYLSIPGSHLEKFMSRWMYTLIIYPLFIFGLSYFLKYSLSIQWPGFGSELNMDFVLEMYKFYVLFHSIVFMFAVWFNKYTAPKAAIFSFFVAMIIVVIFAIFFRTLFAHLFVNLSDMSSDIRILPKPDFQEKIELRVAPNAKAFLHIAVPIFFWTVGYLKLTEKEA